MNLQKNEIGDWVIKMYDDTLLFICNGSRYESLPPKTGWKRFDRADILYQTQLPIIFTFTTMSLQGELVKAKSKHIFKIYYIQIHVST